MANSKKRCLFCKEYFAESTMIKLPIGWFCSQDHVISYAKTKSERNRAAIKKKTYSKQKQDFYASDIRTRKIAARTACHKYIKARDLGNSCICCGRPLGKNYDSGHFLESGNNSFLRYHEDNIHSQSVYCNNYKGGDSGEYEKRLRIKIGDERVDYLLANKGGVIKRTAEDYKAIEDYYKEKLKMLQ